MPRASQVSRRLWVARRRFNNFHPPCMHFGTFLSNLPELAGTGRERSFFIVRLVRFIGRLAATITHSNRCRALTVLDDRSR